MKIALLKSTILPIILSLCVFSYAYTASTDESRMIGVELSKEISSFFTEKGYAIEQQDLLPSDSTSFPQNLIIYVSAEEATNSSKNWVDSAIDTIVFDFTQEFAYSNLENLYNFIEKLKRSELSYTAAILLAANDSIPQLPESAGNSKSHPSGTQSYSSRLGYDDKCAAIVVSPSSGEISITPGSRTDVAPLWLVRSMHRIISEAGRKTNLAPWFTLLYSLGLAPENQRVASFMDMGIPAAGISLENNGSDLELLSSIAVELSGLHKENWDRNYLFFMIGEKSFWIPEAVSVTLLVFVIVAVLLVLCLTGVLPTSRSIALKKDIIRSWIFYPLTIAIVTLILHGAQQILSPLAESNPLLLLSLKLFAAFILILVLFILQISFNIMISLGACGFLMIASSVVNIFVFSAVNLISMYIFALEFIVIYISANAKRTTTLVITMFLMLLPFLGLVGTIAQGTLGSKASRFVMFNWPQEVFFAMVIFPPMMQVERIFISTDLLSTNKKLRRRNYIITSLCAEAVLVVSLWALYGYLNVQIRNFTQLKTVPITMEIRERQDQSVSVEVADSEFMELAMRTLTIIPNEDVLRYEVSIETEGGVPIFESNYEYIFDSPNKISFVIPDYPSGRLELIYSTAKSLSSKITVEAYILDMDHRNIIFKDTHTVRTEPQADSASTIGGL